MPMPSLEEMRQTLHAEVGGVIYARGLAYVTRGKVRTCKVLEDDASHVRISGTVDGTVRYRTTVEYDKGRGVYRELACTCPYGYGCKHAVALLLTYTRTLQRIDKPTRSIPRSTGEEMGTVISREGESEDAAFDRGAYTVMLHRHRRYAASLHLGDRYYEQVDIERILAHARMTEDERTVLTYIYNHNGFSQASSFVHPSDPAILFPLLQATGFALMCNDGYNTCVPRPIVLDLAPPPIRVEVLPEYTSHPGDPTIVRREVVLTLPDERAPGSGAGRSMWSRHGACLLHEKDTKIRLYHLDPVWLELLKAVAPRYREHVARVDEYLYHAMVLPPKILDRLHSFLESVPPQIDLFVSDQIRSMVVHSTHTSRIIEVDLDSVLHTIRVSPCVRYGGWSSPVADMVVRRRHVRNGYSARETFDVPATHALFEDASGTLQYVRRNVKEEISCFKEVEAERERLGFTVMLKCSLQGKQKVARYISEVWPNVRAFAERRGYEIVFLRDSLPKESVSFSADFSAPDLDTDRNWLHFDVELYCAGERVTLEKLYEYMSSGSTFWRKDDGSLVEVENRDELERLVRLLQNFHARQDGGFEGGLHHAPELSYVLTSSPHYTTAQSKSLREFMKRIESGKPIKRVRLPKRVRDTLRPYQRAGVEWLYFLRSYRFAGILADDMGLGKTVQALTVLALERVDGVPSIVVCPKSLLYNWRNEAAAFFPDMRVLVYEGTPVERARLQTDIASYDLVVVGYATLKRDADVLCAPDRRYNYAVLDEAQYIKNHMTKMAQCVKEIPAEYRLALTGTPLENHVFELWSIYDYLMPGFLGRRDHFAERYHKPIMERNDQAVLTQLRKKVECFMLRRTKAEVLSELPPKIEQVVECVLTDAQNIVYQQILNDVRGSVFSAIESKGFRGSQIHILAGLTRLRQACNHPALLTKEEDYAAYESAKLDACLELIEEVRQSGRKVLVFSQFTGMLDILARALAAKDVEFSYLSGKTQRRERVIEHFNTDPAVTAFLISMKAGGTGLNLTAADTVIVFDPWWNPSVENQAIDRAHRIGQTRSVNVYRLLTKGTIEEKIQELKRKKKGIFDAVIGESGGLMEKLTWEDIRELFVE